MSQLSPEECRSEIERLAAELERAQRTSKLAQDELHAFVYTASHDVKESLRSVSSYTQLMMRLPAGSPEFAEFGRYVTDGIKTAVAFLDRMNAFSRIDLSPRTGNVNLAAIVQSVILQQQPFIRDLSAQVTYHDLGSVNVNEAQFMSLMDILVDNALRYRGAAPPRIDIWAEETDEGTVIAVRDNGGGIKPAYHESIFRPFQRLHPKGVSGIGLGLASATKIAAAHQGRIWVESDGASGSTFKVFVPF